MKGFAVFLPNEEDEKAPLCALTFAQVAESETHRPLTRSDGHFPSPTHVISVAVIGRKL